MRLPVSVRQLTGSDVFAGEASADGFVAASAFAELFGDSSSALTHNAAAKPHRRIAIADFMGRASACHGVGADNQTLRWL